MNQGFLPITKQEMKERGWEQLDFVYVCGDAYVDHPSFGHAIITRILEANGYKVGIIAQPDWKDKESIMEFGEPRLGFLVSAGNMDSMVNHYYVSKKRRKTDAFTPGGVMGKRPDYATVVYCNLIRQAYKKIPIIIGGIEASLRRLAHYDYWSDQLKRSILLDSGADILSYGMGERSIVEIAEALDSGIEVKDITYIDGTVCKVKNLDSVYDAIILESFEELKQDKRNYAKSFYTQYCNTDPFQAKRLVEPYQEHLYVVQNPPAKPLSQSEMDRVYSYPYMRTYHPSYKPLGGVPGIEEVEFSITHNRGCFGACNFCSIQFHQGRYITARSKESILEEAKKLTTLKKFKGYIHDIGGPTANFRKPSCEFQLEHGLCKGKKCLAPKPCPNLISNHSEYLDILKTVRALPKVKKVFIRSGIRYDYLLEDKDDTFFKELVENHVSGQLKVAPEHCSASVLDKMGKPHIEAYIEFSKRYFRYTGQINKEQYLVPYLMSSHPGSTLDDAIELACFLKKNHIRPEQVQDFYPTPGTISTCMFYTELDPYTMEKVYVAKTPHDKALQRALLQYYDPKNKQLCVEALKRAHRYDLIGNSKECLVQASAYGADTKQRQFRSKNGNPKNKYAKKSKKR